MRKIQIVSVALPMMVLLCSGTAVAQECWGLTATIVGTDGDDLIEGTDGDDVIVGLDGNDRIYGYGGNDVICGGNGKDAILGGDGNDMLFGNGQRDTIFGGAGNDVLAGNAGRDVLYGEEGDDTLRGGIGDDFLFGGPGSDRLIGARGLDDLCYGSEPEDIIHASCETTVSDFGYKLPDTGQVTCRRQSGEVTNCAGTGQDGEFSINPMSFTDNGDGTVSDNITELMWQQSDDNVQRTWEEAGTYCENLNLGGYSDWGLPSRRELVSITYHERGTDDPAIDEAYFPNTKSDWYWSATEYIVFLPLRAWSVNFRRPDADQGSKTDANYVRCVRGDPFLPEPGFVDNSNRTITDNSTGLIWQQRTHDRRRFWSQALNYCNNLELAGYDDWRLPNIKELESLVDTNRAGPAIDTAYFPDTDRDFAYYWSSSTTASGSWAYIVHFSSGALTSGDSGGLAQLYTRCVR